MEAVCVSCSSTSVENHELDAQNGCSLEGYIVMVMKEHHIHSREPLRLVTGTI